MSQTKEKLKNWLFLLYFPVVILYSELILRITSVEGFFGVGLLFLPIFAVSIGLFLTVFCTLSKSQKTNRIIAIVFSVILFLIYSVQLVYHTLFNQFLVLNSLTEGGMEQIATEGGLVIIGLKGILARLFFIILLAAPFILFIIFGNKAVIFRKVNYVQSLLGFLGSIAVRLVALLLALIIPPAGEIYFGVYNPGRLVSLSGVVNTEWLDFKYNLLGSGKSGDLDIENGETDAPKKDAPIEYNVMNIDFDSLIATETNSTVKKLHEYFKNEAPTEKNAYTGMFKGYNLIMLTAEGFYPFAVDKTLTPTLYKMQQQGFNFTNYYNSPWAVSTSDGEYVECTGLIPKSGIWSFYRSGERNIFFPFSMPQQYLNSGVTTVYGYHNNTYSYYHRDVSHPNIGYLYKGLGNGLNVKKTWPESDKEMIEVTVNEYMNSQPFHAYYMTVSGHMAYDFSNNYMSAKYRSLVENLPYSDAVKAFLACNIDLDRAMESLLKSLEQAGVADKTLIAISPDHTPYGLEQTGANKYAYFDELFGHKVETQFEVNRSVFLLYSPSMKKGIKVNKVCSPLDIIPTLNNLLGFEYDSRLLPGKDIFSSAEGIAIFENHSFISDSGRYFSGSGKFVKNEGVTLENEEEYVSSQKKAINNKFTASSGILDTNYYAKVINRKHIKGKLANK